MTGPEVAIIGGGASGMLTAIHLLASRSHDLRVTLHESSGEIGRGVAYGTTDARHLLNVRLRHMSAFPDIPSDLVEWAARTGRETDAQAFLPRRDYATYLRETLERMADDRLSVRSGTVTDVVPTADGFEVHADDAISSPTAVVLAYGNLPPAPLAVDGVELADASWHTPNPWDLASFRDLPADAVVVIVGSGLTAIDTAITLLDDEPGRRVVLTSRHGLLPKAHIEQQSTVWLSPVPQGPVTADQLAELVRDQIEAAARHDVDWRNVVDGLRQPTQSLWLRLPLDERRRFLSEYGRHWEIRRHRMAPEVAARIADYRSAGRLELHAGGLTSVADLGDRARVGLVGRDDLVVDAVVNCTGPMTDVARTTDPLLRALVERGTVTPDPLRLGLDCSAVGEVLDVSGQVVTGLYAVGPPRKGTLYESTAVPEIRTQAAALAALLPGRSRLPRTTVAV